MSNLINTPAEVTSIVNDIWNTKLNNNMLYKYLSASWGIKQTFKLRSYKGKHKSVNLITKRASLLDCYNGKYLVVSARKTTIIYPLLYVDKNSNLWVINIANIWNLAKRDNKFYVNSKSKKDSPAYTNNGKMIIGTFLQSQERIMNILEESNPYLAKYCTRACLDARLGVMIPEIEILDKAGYMFTNNYKFRTLIGFFKYLDGKTFRLQQFNDCVSYGNNPKEIFRCQKSIYKTLKDEKDIKYLRFFKKLGNYYLLNKNIVSDIYLNIEYKDYRYFISKFKYINQVFNSIDVNKMLKAINSLKNCNGLSCRQSIDYVYDYCKGCYYLRKKPRILSKNIVELHDRTMVEYERWLTSHNDEQEGQIPNIYNIFDYKEDKYFVKVLRTKEEFVNEGKQQCNCVSMYYKSAIKGDVLIWAARKCDDPSTSWITLMPDSFMNKFNQCYLSYNRPVKDLEAKEFLSRALANARKVIKGTVDPIKIDIKDNELVVGKVS